MSGTLLLVLYPDDSIRCGHYRGSSDSAFPNLYYRPPNYDRSIGIHPEHPDDVPPSSPIDLLWDVMVYARYGRGISWRGEASKWELHTTHPYRLEDQAGNAIIEDAPDVHDGHWSWVPKVWPHLFDGEEFTP